MLIYLSMAALTAFLLIGVISDWYSDLLPSDVFLGMMLGAIWPLSLPVALVVALIIFLTD